MSRQVTAFFINGLDNVMVAAACLKGEQQYFPSNDGLYTTPQIRRQTNDQSKNTTVNTQPRSRKWLPVKSDKTIYNQLKPEGIPNMLKHRAVAFLLNRIFHA